MKNDWDTVWQMGGEQVESGKLGGGSRFILFKAIVRYKVYRQSVTQCLKKNVSKNNYQAVCQ